MQRRFSRILVTGGCGFIGSNFILALRGRRPETTIVNLDKLTYAGNRMNLAGLEGRDNGYVFVYGDIADPILVPKILAEHGIQAVLNFAAESHVDRSIHDPAPFITTNVQGTQNLLEASRRAGVELFVQVSTDEVYGTLGPTGLFSESTPLAPNSPYAASKASADLLVRAYHKTYGLPTVITRCSNNYGPFQFPEKLIPLMLTLAWEDEPLPIYGDGANIRDWIHVLDHCRGVELAMERGRPGAVYNFGGNAERTNIEVVKALLNFLGKPHDLICFVQDRPGHDWRYAMDYSLAARELGFAPEYTFEQGLEETIAWYAENKEWLDRVRDGSYREFMAVWYGGRQVSSRKKCAVVLGGKTGLLGQALSNCLAGAGWRVVSVGRDDLDFLDAEQMAALIDRHAPEVLFNAVAYTQVDKAEDEPEEAFRLNERLPILLGRLAGKSGVRLVHYSTDFVFDGQKHSPYLPDDPTGPLCVYGKSKLAGERALLDLDPKGLCIIRTAWLFGPGRTNFVAKILELAKGRESLNVVHDQVGSPTYTPDLAAHSLELVAAGGQGVFHLVNSGSASWCELAGEAVQIMGLRCAVNPIPSSEYPRKAVRPAYSVLDATSFSKLTGTKPRAWLQALREYVSGLIPRRDFQG